MNKIVMVLTTLRSGSSLMAGILHKLGVSMGSPLKRSYYEHVGIDKIFCDILNYYNVNQISAASSGFKLPDDWRSDGQLAVWFGDLVDILDNELVSRRLSAFKNTKTAMLMPIMQGVFEGFNGVEPLAIVMDRNPVEIIHSYERYYGNSIDDIPGTYAYHKSFLGDVPFRNTTVSYSELLNDWRGTASRIATDLDIEWPNSIDAAAPAIERFLYLDARHFYSNTNLDEDSLSGNEAVDEHYAD